MSRQRLAIAGIFGALLLAFGAGLYAGVSERGANAAGATFIVGTPAEDRVDLAQFWQAWATLEGSFVQTHASGTIPSDKEKLYGAIKGLAEAYGDPYTVFFPPQEAQIFNENVQGSFSGVGMELGQRDGALTVVAPLKNSPAERAGVKSGDTIVMVNEKSTDSMSVDEAVQIIRGPKGTTVTLTLVRKNEPKPIVVSIVRDIINIPVISTKETGDVFVIELYSFSQTSPDLFRDALRKFFESGKTKLVLDLRGNPGGYLEAAVDMASYFLPVGEEVVTEDTKGHGNNTVHRSLGYNVFANKKLSMVVLVNEGSASASEILAGALSQHGVAKLLGTRTFGKGSVQQLVDLGDGAELKITTARWLTPNGTSISDGGLTPDLAVERTAEDIAAGRDPQMDAALAWLVKQ